MMARAACRRNNSQDYAAESVKEWSRTLAVWLRGTWIHADMLSSSQLKIYPQGQQHYPKHVKRCSLHGAWEVPGQTITCDSDSAYMVPIPKILHLTEFMLLVFFQVYREASRGLWKHLHLQIKAKWASVFCSISAKRKKGGKWNNKGWRGEFRQTQNPSKSRIK